MVKRVLLLLPALLLAGCPDGIGRGPSQVIVTGLLAPSGLNVEVDGGSRVVLRWSDHAGIETGYRLEMANDAFNFMASILDVRFLPANATSFVYPTVPNTTYFFRVFAITQTMESDPSNVAVAYTPNVPLQPTGLAADPNTSSEIGLSWIDVAEESGYLIERSTDGGLTWFAAGSTPADVISFVSAGMSPDTEYAHRIVALGVGGRSTPSDPAFAQTTTASMLFFAGTSSGNNGQFTSIAVEPGGREHIAHYDVTNTNVLYTTRLAPSAYVTTTIDSGPAGIEDVGGDGTSIAVDPVGKVHVVAHDRSSNRPRYLTNSTGTWTRTNLDNVSSGEQPRIVCNPSTGELHVSYQDGAALGLSYVRKPPGGPWSLPGLSPSSVPTARHSLALYSTGEPLLLGVDPRNDIRVYIGRLGSGPSWAAYPVVPLVLPSLPQVGDTSMAADEIGNIYVAFHEKTSGALYVASYFSGWVLETVDRSEGFDLGSSCSLVVQPSTRRLHLAYYDATRKDLRYARKDPGGLWVRRIIEAVGDVGSHASIAVDGTGKVYIAYRDETRRRMRVASGTP